MRYTYTHGDMLDNHLKVEFWTQRPHKEHVLSAWLLFTEKVQKLNKRAKLMLRIDSILLFSSLRIFNLQELHPA